MFTYALCWSTLLITLKYVSVTLVLLYMFRIRQERDRLREVVQGETKLVRVQNNLQYEADQYIELLRNFVPEPKRDLLEQYISLFFLARTKIKEEELKHIDKEIAAKLTKLKEGL